MKPVIQALVVAERIYVDHDTRRKVIAGTITELWIVKRTAVESNLDDGRKVVSVSIQGSPYAYLSLTSVQDGTTLGLQFVSLKRNKVMFGTDITLNCKDRLETIEIAVALPELNLPEPGVYAFEVICDGEIIGSARIVARDVGEQSDDNQEAGE